MRPRLALAGALLPAACVWAQTESAESIMARVAENQERAQAARAEFVYRQNVLIRLKRANGKVAREEEREYVVTPTEKGFHKELARFTGKYEKGGTLVPYDKPGHRYRSVDIDGELADEMAGGLANEKKARDGIAIGFPLTGAQQKKYLFQLEGQENYRGSPAYKVTFKPRKPSLLDCDDDDENACWLGEVLVDAKEYQPLLITAFLSKGVPLWVQTVLGTNVRHLGFKVTYQRFDEGLWFPVTYGGEFEVKAVFFYKRRFAIALTNSGFQRAGVSSRVRFGEPAHP